MDLRNQGVAAVPVIAAATLLSQHVSNSTQNEFLPLGGIANKVTVNCNENGGWLIFESDEHGFHNPPGVWGRRPIEVVALGDSFTYGACIQSDKISLP